MLSVIELHILTPWQVWICYHVTYILSDRKQAFQYNPCNRQRPLKYVLYSVFRVCINAKYILSLVHVRINLNSLQ